MAASEQTCWTLVEGAAAGDAESRAVFARVYLPVVRAYLAARWTSSPLRRDSLEDAVQETFLECFRPAGALEGMDAPRSGRFRTYLHAVTTNVARRIEERAGARRAAASPAEDVPADEARLSRAFDRAWASALLREAAARQEETARTRGPEAVRRVELMRLRFAEDQPIREIAERWGEDAAVVHREYAKARDEFKQALVAVIAFHHACTPAEAERQCRELLELLG